MHLTSHLGARPVWNEEHRGLRARRAAAGHGASPARQRQARPRRCLETGAQDGARGRGRLRLRRPARRPCPRSTPRARRLTPLWHVRGTRGKAFVDFQNDVTADGHRAGRARGLPLGRASEALHHARHGDRPGQDLQRHRPRADGRADRPDHPADRHDDLPPALRAGRDRRARRPLTAARSSARRGCRRRIAGRRSRARCSSRPAPGCARSSIRGPARPTGSRPSSARCRTVRERVGVCDVSTLGKIDVQGPDAGRVPRPPLHQHLDHAAGRPRALRPDAARGRLRPGRRHHLAPRRRPLLRHDHHGQRREGAAAHGVLPSGAVAGARRADVLGHRAVGAVLDRRPALARRAAQARRSAARHLQRGLSLHGGGAR